MLTFIYLSYNFKLMLEKSEKEVRSNVIVEIDKYAILLNSRNYIVAAKTNTDANADPFDVNSYTYHISLDQALQNLSKRILEEKIKSKTTERALNLKELTELCREHHNYFVNISKGVI